MSEDVRETAREKQRTSCFPIVSGCYVPKRYIVTFLAGLGMTLTYAMRVNVGVTVITILDRRAHEKVGTVEAMFNLPSVQWDTRMIGFLHSVFYIGFLVTQIPGAYFTTLWPSNRLFSGCILLSSTLNMLLPVGIEKVGYSFTCAVRCCQGLSEGLLYPSCYDVLRHWSAPNERSRLVSSVLTGAYAGAIVGFPLAGVITHYVGWQYTYYVSGGSCILWYLFWLCLVYQKPSHHPSIAEKEYEYLEKAQGQDVIDFVNLEIPWRHILTSLPVLALCFCHFARKWVFVLLLTNEPFYLNIFGFSIAANGLYSSIPHIAKVVVSIISGYVADALLSLATCSTNLVRKILTAIGLGVQGTCFFVLTFLENGTAVIIVLSIALGFFGLSTSGWQVNHYDLSTRYASSLVAVSSTFGTIGAIIVPLVVGEFTYNKDLAGWDHVFYMTGAIVLFAVIFFSIFGSGEQQPWAVPPAHIELIQKTDPLARKPYTLHTLKSQSASGVNKSNNSTDKSKLVDSDGSKYGTDGVDTDHLARNLMQKITDEGVAQMSSQTEKK